MTTMNDKRASLEALLFIHGEPLTCKKIEAVLGIGRDELDAIIADLKRDLEAEHRGLQLITDRDKVQLATKPAYNTILESFVKEEISEDLTPASLEALAIIAYLGPISRARIEYLRGVNSIVILRSLMIRGLVERSPDPEHPNSFLYRATFDLMKHLGITEKTQLPDFEKFQELLKVFDQTTQAEQNSQTPQASPGTAAPAPQGEQDIPSV